MSTSTATFDKPLMVLYVDGGVAGKKGVYFSIARDKHDRLEFWERKRKDANYTTSQEAEYLAIFNALHHLTLNKAWSPHRVIIYSDCDVVIRQLNGRSEVKIKRLIKLRDKINRFYALLRDRKWEIEFKWTTREEVFEKLRH